MDLSCTVTPGRVATCLLLLLGAAFVWNGLTEPAPPVAPSPELPLSVMEDVHLSGRSPKGFSVKASASRVELKRDFRHIISFAGQYVIQVDGVVLSYDLDRVDQATLTAVGRDMPRRLTFYPKAWEKIATPVYDDVSLHFLHHGVELLALTGGKAHIKGNGCS